LRNIFKKKNQESVKETESIPNNTKTETAEPDKPGFFNHSKDKSASTDLKAASEKNKEKGFFHRLKNRLTKTRRGFLNGIEKVFEGKTAIDDDLLEELEELLITSDIGVQTSMDLILSLKKKASNISTANQLKAALKEEISSLLNIPHETGARTDDIRKPHIVMVVGVNGVGKTTTIGKIAAKASGEGKSVLIAAADTFRAAAIDQLSIWADRAGANLVKHIDNADPAAVVFDSIETAMAREVDLVLIDTAGRLHTKVNLMEELKKIARTVSKKIPGAPHEILLVLDATTGQNAISQARIFNEALKVTGIALAKLDGTAKGGIVISICQTFNIPLKYIGIGESIEDLQDFDPEVFTNALFEEPQPYNGIG